MTILFVGDLNPRSRSVQRRRALEECGHRVVAHSSVPSGVALDWKPWLPWRLLWKAGLPPDLTATNAAIRRRVAGDAPDVLWIEKGNTVWPGTLAFVRRVSPRTRIVSYSEDDMFAGHNRSLFYRRGIGHYDVVFTTKSYNCRPSELPRLGARHVVFVDKAYDVHAHRPLRLDAADVGAYGADVSFIGSYERERAHSLQVLAESGITVRVWGAGGWKRRAGWHRNLRLEDQPLYGEAYAKALCASRISLCFLRKRNRDLQTDRTMEIPACAAFMLAERTSEHLRLFEEGREAAYFDGDEEMVGKARYYLERDDERVAIAAAARRRCVESGYSHHDRLRYMLRVLRDAAVA
jgi:hypothetical protein